MIDIKIKCNCSYCSYNLQIDECVVYCNKCNDMLFSTVAIEEALLEICGFDSEWKDGSVYDGFDSEEQKEFFMFGIKHGYNTEAVNSYDI